MQILPQILLCFALGVVPYIAVAAKGAVVYKKSGCAYYIVETAAGYALLEWFGGNDPDEEDIIDGDYESYGMKTVRNVTANSDTQVWVDDFWLSRTSVLEKYRRKCRR